MNQIKELFKELYDTIVLLSALINHYGLYLYLKLLFLGHKILVYSYNTLFYIRKLVLYVFNLFHLGFFYVYKYTIEAFQLLNKGINYFYKGYLALINKYVKYYYKILDEYENNN